MTGPRSFPVPFPERPCPARFFYLARAGQRQRIRRDVLRNHGPRSDIGAVTDLDRRHQGAIRADERMRANLRAILGEAVVIAGNRSRADIRPGADARISNVAQMVNLGARADLRGLHLDEIADVHVLREAAAGAQPGEGADRRILADRRALQIGKRADAAAFADAHTRTEDHMWLDDNVTAKPRVKG